MFGIKRSRASGAVLQWYLLACNGVKPYLNYLKGGLFPRQREQLSNRPTSCTKKTPWLSLSPCPQPPPRTSLPSVLCSSRRHCTALSRCHNALAPRPSPLSRLRPFALRSSPTSLTPRSHPLPPLSIATHSPPRCPCPPMQCPTPRIHAALTPRNPQPPPPQDGGCPHIPPSHLHHAEPNSGIFLGSFEKKLEWNNIPGFDHHRSPTCCRDPDQSLVQKTLYW